MAVIHGTNDNEKPADCSTNSSFDVTMGNPGPPGTFGQSGTITLDVQGKVYQNNVEKVHYKRGEPQ